MKQLRLLIALLPVLFLSGCGNKLEKELIGTWQPEKIGFYTSETFNADGTYTTESDEAFTVGSSSTYVPSGKTQVLLSGTYKWADKETIEITIPPDKTEPKTMIVVQRVSIDGDTLTLDDVPSEGKPKRYKRIK